MSKATTFFGSSWVGGATALRLVALAAAIDFATQAANTVFLAHGRTAVLTAGQAIRLLVLLLLCGLVIPIQGFSLEAVAASVLASAVVAEMYAQLRVFRLLGLLARSVLPTQGAIAACTMIMAAAVLVILGRQNSDVLPKVHAAGNRAAAV